MMPKHLPSSATAGALALILCLGAAPAQSAPVSFVSTKGANAGNCSSPASPCLSFQYAMGQTAAGGEIQALDPGNYGPVTINKSITITGVEGAGIIRGSAGDAITINAGPGDAVSLVGLTIDGFKGAASNGVTLNKAGSLAIKNCIIRNFHAVNISLAPTSETKAVIEDAVVSGAITNMLLSPVTLSGGLLYLTMNRVTVTRGIDGVHMLAYVIANISNSAITQNADVGIRVANPTAGLWLDGSAITLNGTGVKAHAGATSESAGNNFIRRNTTANVDGPLVKVGTL